jgi:thiol-disulfide isomerase/thioredoxin
MLSKRNRDPISPLVLAMLLSAPASIAAQDAPAPKPEQAEAPKEASDPKAAPADALPAAAEKSIPWHHDIAKAFAAAREQSRLLIIDFEAEWCGFCKKLDRETYGHEEVIRFVTAHFVALKVDTDKHPEMGKRFAIAGLPTIVFLDPNRKAAEEKTEADGAGADGAAKKAVPADDGHGDDDHDHDHELPAYQELGRIEGFRPPEPFLAEARKFAQAGASLAELREAAEKAPADADAQRAYGRALILGGRLDDALALLERADREIPESPEIQLELAEALRLKSDFARAGEFFAKVLGSAKAAASLRDLAVVPQARCLLSLRRVEDAEKTLSLLLDRPEHQAPPKPVPAPVPEKPASGEEDAAPAPLPSLPAHVLEALFLRGYARALLARPADALADLKRAKDGDPEGPWGMRAGFIASRLEP